LTNKPIVVVLTTLLSEVLNSSEISFFICCTVETAINFLDKEGLNKEVLEELINELKENKQIRD